MNTLTAEEAKIVAFVAAKVFEVITKGCPALLDGADGLIVFGSGMIDGLELAGQHDLAERVRNWTPVMLAKFILENK
jgi:hypothetical protein